ncbi:MAG TPA: hypothetical protein VER03_10360 [Bryobacteraceae bacterium]|nr:hypothetical protein [Bryobacteraceae bacterium]
MSRRRAQMQGGHALLEGALILTVFVGFCLGTMDFAQFLYFHQSLVERARVAARYAAVHPSDTVGTKNMAIYNSAAGGVNPLLPGLTADQVAVESLGSGTDARVSVTITGYQVRFFSMGIAGNRSTAPVSVTMASEAP